MARILRQTTVVRDGMHNGFTDLAYWQGNFWVSYRKGASHVATDGQVCLSMSNDGQRFQEVAKLRVPGDPRDPKLAITPDGRLAMLFPSWLPESFDHNGKLVALKMRLQQYVTFSEDGINWDKPLPIYEPNRWIWRVREHEGRYYGLAYGLTETGNWGHEKPGVDLQLLVSDDLMSWELLSSIGGTQEALGESDIHFRDDGEAWIIARRCIEPIHARFCIAKPPYTNWQITNLGMVVQSPAFLASQGRLYLAGRCEVTDNQDTTWPFGTSKSLSIWNVQRNKLETLLRIPATGDCAYPGFIKHPDGQIYMSYYSQHAYDMGIVEDRYRKQTTESGTQGELLKQNDVYFAQLSLD